MRAFDYTKYYQVHNLISLGITPSYWQRLGVHFRICRGFNICIEVGPIYLTWEHHDKPTREWLDAMKTHEITPEENIHGNK